jgi:hypothetical protein
MSDVLLYPLRLEGEIENIPVEAASLKVRLNTAKHVVHLARESSQKYTEF